MAARRASDDRRRHQAGRRGVPPADARLASSLGAGQRVHHRRLLQRGQRGTLPNVHHAGQRPLPVRRRRPAHRRFHVREHGAAAGPQSPEGAGRHAPPAPERHVLHHVVGVRDAAGRAHRGPGSLGGEGAVRGQRQRGDDVRPAPGPSPHRARQDRQDGGRLPRQLRHRLGGSGQQLLARAGPGPGRASAGRRRERGDPSVQSNRSVREGHRGAQGRPRRRHRRAGAWRRRVHSTGAGVPGVSARHHDPARHRADLRRDDHPRHRQRRRAGVLRRHPRPDDGGQVGGRRHAHGVLRRPRGADESHGRRPRRRTARR